MKADKKGDEGFQEPFERLASKESIRCPKCGLIQKRSSQCVKCKTNLYDRKNVLYTEITPAKKYNRLIVYSIVGMIIFTTLLVVYLGSTDRELGLEFSEGPAEARIDVEDKSGLADYALDMQAYISNLETVIKNWDKMKQGQNKWEAEYESTLVNVSTLYENVSSIKPPKEIKSYHSKFVELNEFAMKELENVKTTFTSKSEIVGTEARRARRFNTVNVIMRDIKDYIGSFEQLLNGVCKYNKLICRI